MGATSHCAGNAIWAGPLHLQSQACSLSQQSYMLHSLYGTTQRGSLQKDPQRQNHVFDDMGSSWIKGGPGEKQVTFLRAVTLTPIGWSPLS